MRAKLTLQVGAFHKDQESPDADFLKLLDNPKELLEWVMNSWHFEFKVKDIYRLADGCPHLIQFEAITDRNLLTNPKEENHESYNKAGTTRTDVNDTQTV